jgi:hypothetical protein
MDGKHGWDKYKGEGLWASEPVSQWAGEPVSQWAGVSVGQRMAFGCKGSIPERKCVY